MRNPYFTTGVPYEALADLLIAIRRPRGAGRRSSLDPGFSSRVSAKMLPPLIQDADPRPDLVGWQAGADPVLGASYLWCASFSAGVPHGLAAAFAFLLPSPVPIPRHVVPESAEGRLTVVRRS